MRALAAHDSVEVAEYAAVAATAYRTLYWPVHEQQVLSLVRLAKGITEKRAVEKVETSMLSARELEIAELVVAGVPNKSLAQRLTISQRTVEKHLTSIFNKLGLRSRTELVALMLRRPL